MLMESRDVVVARDDAARHVLDEFVIDVLLDVAREASHPEHRWMGAEQVDLRGGRELLAQLEWPRRHPLAVPLPGFLP